MNTQLFTREALYDMVWSEPLTTIAKRFNISDNGIRKKCIKHNIPVPPVGYWSKLKYGKQPNRTPLPQSKEEVEILLYSIDEDDSQTSFISKLKHRILELKEDKNVSYKVPDRLTNMDPLIKPTLDYFNMTREKKNNVSWQYLYYNILDISVTEKHQSRAPR